MSEVSSNPVVLVDRVDDVVRIRLNRPHCGNALVPELLDSLSAALAECRTARAVVLSGEGRAFSSGGDIGAFHAHANDLAELEGFGSRLVSALNKTLLALRDLPCPSLAAVNGPVTGGAIGLMLACDVSVMRRDAFIQPYYGKMGFAPDGGWTALMPERIGTARTASWLALDTRVSAIAAFEMGLVDQLAAPDEFENCVNAAVKTLTGHERAVAATTRRLLDTRSPEDALEARLERERAAFCQLLIRPAARTRMADFLAAGKSAE